MWLPNDPKFKSYNDYAIDETTNGRRPLTPDAWLKMMLLRQQSQNQQNQGQDQDQDDPGLILNRY